MRTVRVVLAALVSMVTLASGAFAAGFQGADASVTSGTHAAVVPTVTGSSVLTGTLDSLDGVPLNSDGQLRARVSATNSAAVALDEVVLRLDLTRQPLKDRQALAEFVADPTGVEREAAAQHPPALEPPHAADGDTSGAEPTSGTVSDKGTTAPTTASGLTAEPTGAGENDEEPIAPVGERIAPGASITFSLTATASDLGLPSQGWGVHGASLWLVTPDLEVLVDSFALTWGAQAVPPLDLAVLAVAHGEPSQAFTTLEASNLPGVAVAVDPSFLAAQHVVGDTLRDTEVFRLPVHSPDLSSLAHSGNRNLMPLALSLTGTIDVPAVSLAPWIATPAAVDSTSVGYAAELDAAAVLALPGAAGYRALAETASGPVVSAHGTPVLIPDATLSETVDQFRPGTSAAKAYALADSALLAGTGSNSRVLVTFDSHGHLGTGAHATVTALLDAPWVSSIPVSQLLASPGRSVPLPTTLNSASQLPAERIDDLGQRLDDLALLATIAQSPEEALNDWGSDLIRGIAVNNDVDYPSRVTTLEAAIERADVTLGAVRIADSSDLNLLTESGDIPVHVVNGLSHPINVNVYLNSFSSNLQILESPTVSVPAGSDQVALIPVEAVSNANVLIAAVLRNSDSQPVSEVQVFSIRIRADWGNAATAVFTVVLVLLLIAGLIRTIRRGRKDTRTKPSTPPETMADEHD